MLERGAVGEIMGGDIGYMVDGVVMEDVEERGSEEIVVGDYLSFYPKRMGSCHISIAAYPIHCQDEILALAIESRPQRTSSK